MPKKKDKESPVNFYRDMDEEEYTSWVDKQVNDHPVVRTHHGKWEELIQWCDNNNQFALWSETKRSVIPVELKIRKKMVVINLMKPLVEAIEGKLNMMHKIIGVPNSAEVKDIKGAEVATKFISYNDYVNGMEKLQEDLKYDLLRPGIAIRKWFWDKSAYGYRKSKKGQPAQEKGEVLGKVIPAFNIRILPTMARKPEDIEEIIEIYKVSKDTLKDDFGLSDEEIKGLPDEAYEGYKEYKDEIDKDEENPIIKEHWVKESELYPNGKLIFSVGNKVLRDDNNPSPEAELPYFFYFYKKSPYSFWPKGPLHYVQDIQREFNRMISIKSEHIEAWRPKMSVGQGALKRANSMTVDQFEIVEVDYSRGEPRAMNMPPLSPEVNNYINDLIGYVDKVSNVHEVSYSRLPQYASRAPASLYGMMLEQENAKLEPMVARMNKTLEEEARFRLKLMDKHYKLPRMVKIIGTDRASVLEYFSASDLNQSFDVRLEVGVNLNQSPTIQQRTLIEMWNAGILKEEDRQKLISLVNLGTAEMELRSDMADKDRVMRENQAFIDNKAHHPREKGGVYVYLHDDHEMHLDFHTDLRKSKETEKWSEERLQALDLHIEDHIQMLEQIKQSMMQANQPTPQGLTGPQPSGMGPGGAPPGPVPAEGSMGGMIEGPAGMAGQ